MLRDEQQLRDGFADRLRVVREGFVHEGKRAISREQFAQRLGIEAPRYHRYERAEVLPPFVVLVAIADLTGVTLDHLMNGKPEPMRMQHQIGLSDRLRWLRELFEPDVMRFAEVMRCTMVAWRYYEFGQAELPPDKRAEFCVRLNLSERFLLTGALDGLSPLVAFHLLRAHPELAPPGYFDQIANALSGSEAASNARVDIPAPPVPRSATLLKTRL